jgi:lysophospholipase L1-like esterase
MQFGANDNGDADAFRGYLRQFVNDTRQQGATPILCSLTPRKAWTADGKFHRDNTTHAAWAAEVAKETNAPFVDLYELIARKYESLGSEQVDALYVPSPMERLHTGWKGAVINADRVIEGLKQLGNNPLAAFLR